MIFIIEQPVFSESTTDPLELASLFAACRDVRRHLVLTDPIYRVDHDTPVTQWLRLQSDRMRREFTRILCDSVVGNSTTAKRPTMRVAPIKNSEWKRSPAPPRISVADAARLAHSPLRLLVENRRSDGAFLQRLFGIAPDAERQLLHRALEHGWMQFDNGGGLEDICAWIEHLTQASDTVMNLWVSRLRLWVMFDRDTDPKDRSKPSTSSEAACRAMEALAHVSGHNSSMHRLERRAIENYLPKQTLRKWAEQHSGPDKIRLREAADFFADDAMNDPLGKNRLRHSFNMKDGFVRDAPSWRRVRAEIENVPRALHDDELDELYRTLPTDARLALAAGFDKDVGKQCFPSRTLVQDEWLEEEIPPHERKTILRGIFERL